MKNTTTMTLAALAAVVFLGITAAPDAAAKKPSGPDNTAISKEIKEIQKRVDKANDAAADSKAENSRGRNKVEENLDQKEREVDDAQANLDKATGKGKATAQKKLTKAEKARDDSMEVADDTRAFNPDKDGAYRDALERKRAERKRLKALIGFLKPRLQHFRPKVNPIIQRASKALGDAQKIPTGNVGTISSNRISNAGTTRAALAIATRNRGPQDHCRF